MRRQIAQLDFLEWHAWDSLAFLNNYGDAHPSWSAVKNTQNVPPRTARNATARCITGHVDFNPAAEQAAQSQERPAQAAPRISWVRCDAQRFRREYFGDGP